MNRVIVLVLLMTTLLADVLSLGLDGGFSIGGDGQGGVKAKGNVGLKGLPLGLGVEGTGDLDFGGKKGLAANAGVKGKLGDTTLAEGNLGASGDGIKGDVKAGSS